MGARTKLNVANINAVLLIAGVLGYATESWIVFAIVAVVFIGCSVFTGGIRPTSRRR